MAKDGIGNELTIGKKIVFNGLVYTIKEVLENRVLGGGRFVPQGVQGMKIPDELVLELHLPFDASKPFNGIICQEPPNSDASAN